MIFTNSSDYEQNITIYKDGDSTSVTTMLPVDGSYIITVYDVVDDVISDEPAIIRGELPPIISSELLLDFLMYSVII